MFLRRSSNGLARAGSEPVGGSGFFGREKAELQGVDVLVQFRPQYPVNQTLALDTPHPAEGVGDNRDGEVGLAFWTPARMAAVLMGVIADNHMAWG